MTRNVPLDELLRFRVMQVSKPVERIALAARRVQFEDSRQRLKHYILHRLILSALGSRSISAMPVVAKRVPPHVGGRIERLNRKQLLIEVEHRTHALLADGEREFFNPNDARDR